MKSPVPTILDWLSAVFSPGRGQDPKPHQRSAATAKVGHDSSKTASLSIPVEAINLILDSEGLDQPWKWPGASSGITIGHGYDLGYVSAEEFRRDWKAYLRLNELALLTTAIGITGRAAKAIETRFRSIQISRSVARRVFDSVTVPKWIQITADAFPGFATLPMRARGALVSLTFNRGPSMKGSRRREMLTLRDLVWQYYRATTRNATTEDRKRILAAMANAVRSMKRLWVGKGVDGLLVRRDREAHMIATALD
jgi:GH24 family phage-related lysozyme (muramidase)